MARRSGRGASTPALVHLGRAGVSATIHEYEHDPSAPSYGLEAAMELGVEAARVFKTLVVDAGQSLAVMVLPVDRSLDLKAAGAALGVKKVALADPAAAERATGYVVGGISPLGQRTRLRTVLDVSALDHDTVFVSGGRRGLDVEIAPQDLLTHVPATTAPIAKG